MNSLAKRRAFEKKYNQRWGWFCEDVPEASRMDTMMVLENSYRMMVNEGVLTEGWLEGMLEQAAALKEQENALTEDLIMEAPQTSAAVGDYVIPKVMFPIIKRVLPELIANKLVSLQPLSLPSGVIYFITYRYSNTKGGVTAGDEASFNPYHTTPAYSTYYSSEKFPIECSVTVASGSATTTVKEKAQLSGIETFLDDDAFNTSAYKRIEIADKTTHKTLIAKALVASSTAETLTFYSDDKTTKIATITLKSGSEAIALEDVVVSALGMATGDKVVVYVVYNQEGTSHIPEMEFDMDHMDVDLQTKKLKVRWTKEAEQDMNAYHKVDVENELVKVAAIQNNYETDRMIVEAIDDIVISELCGEFDWEDDDNNGTGGNYLDRHRALAQRLYQYTTKVAMFSRIKPADWAVCTPQVAAALQMLPDWQHGEIKGNKSTFYNAGALGNGTLTVYCDPNRMNNDITMGFKPTDTTYGAGIVYAPYANWMSQTLTNPDNFNSVRGTFSRFAITATPRAEFNYARVTLDNFAI